MKRILFVLILFIIIISCKKKEDDIEYHDLTGEIIYTDSFIPNIWESPFNRRKISEIDKDIGQFIKNDVVDPRLRKIISLMESFIKLMKEKKLEEIEKNLTPSAFNSFKLRYNEIKINEDYYMRVAYPEFMMILVPPKKKEMSDTENIKKDKKDLKNSSDKSEKPVTNEIPVVKDEKKISAVINEKKFWINFKLIFPSASIKSSVELENINDKYVISDFDNQFFEDLKNLSNFNKKKK